MPGLRKVITETLTGNTLTIISGVTPFPPKSGRMDINLRNKEGYPQYMLISEWGNPQKSIPAESNIDFEIFLPDLILYRLHPTDKIG